MLYDYLKRGVAAGVVAGLAYGLFVALVANPLSQYVETVGHEHAHEHGHAHDHSHAVSELTTTVVSIGSGVLWAIFLGGVFAIALYFLEPALPGRDTVKAYVLAGAGFLTVSATPWLVLPPAVPGAEHLYGVQTRQALYVALVVVGAIVAAVSILAYKRTAPRHPLAGVVAGAVPLLAVGITLPLLTPTTVSHPGLSADLVAAYQGVVVLSQGALWALLAGTFGWLHGRDSAATTDVTAGMPRESATRDDRVANP
ncbi:CbtA family protein [Halopiger aswanensis]|uniref:Putative cobalt transporter CbtA n=1 Tax=Halopiger aswanensis TaxID=148449 RepID=A0A3R7DBK9_9EURY|nr:CbtA family protein [Halopiger aswanensis]RKD97383.1 putative cobalt transporter CbtA [Halopiger aswanensis]